VLGVGSKQLTIADQNVKVRIRTIFKKNIKALEKEVMTGAKS
jgi:hypothetical protein